MKITPSVLVNVVLTTILTTSLFFVASGVQFDSNPNASAAEYDPWLDYDENGIINMLDLYNTAQAYGTTGDSTKNMNVTNWPTNYLAYSTVTSVAASSTFYTPYIQLDGYSKVSICFQCDSIDNYIAVQTRHSGGPQVFYMFTQFDLAGYFVETYDVPNEEIRVYFINYETSAADLRCDIYLIR